MLGGKGKIKQYHPSQPWRQAVKFRFQHFPNLRVGQTSKFLFSKLFGCSRENFCRCKLVTNSSWLSVYENLDNCFICLFLLTFILWLSVHETLVFAIKFFDAAIFIFFVGSAEHENLLCRHHSPFAILGCTLSCALVKEMVVLNFLFFFMYKVEIRSLFDKSASVHIILFLIFCFVFSSWWWCIFWVSAHLSFAEDDHVGPDLPIVGEHVDKPARLVPKWLIALTKISVKWRNPSVISFQYNRSRTGLGAKKKGTTKYILQTAPSLSLQHWVHPDLGQHAPCAEKEITFHFQNGHIHQAGFVNNDNQRLPNVRWENICIFNWPNHGCYFV